MEPEDYQSLRAKLIQYETELDELLGREKHMRTDGAWKAHVVRVMRVFDEFPQPSQFRVVHGSPECEKNFGQPQDDSELAGEEAYSQCSKHRDESTRRMVHTYDDAERTRACAELSEYSYADSKQVRP